MNSVKTLTGILILQILLVVGFTVSGGNDLAVFSSDEPVFDFSSDEVQAVTVVAKDKSLEISKKDGDWIIPAVDDFPADAKKVLEFLETVTSLKKSWPVAQSESGLKPLKVSDDDFERKIAFAGKDGTLGSLILGSSPGFKKVYARVAGTTIVYSIEMAAFELPAEPDAWTSKEYLYTDKEAVTEVSLPNVTLIRKGEGFVLSDLNESEEMVAKEVESLLLQVTKPRYVKVLGTSAPEGYDALDTEVRFAVSSADAEVSKEFLAKGLYEESFYVLKEKSSPFYFKVSKGIFDRLSSATREQLVSLKETETKAAAEQGVKSEEKPETEAVSAP